MDRKLDGRISRLATATLGCIGMVLGLGSCGGGGGGGSPPPPPPPPPGIDVSAGLDAAASVSPGATLTYTVSMTVTGGTASEVTATLTLPASGTVGAISDGGVLAGNQVTWPAIATLAAGTATRTVDVTAPSIGPLDAVLQVTTSSTESSVANNSANRRTVLGFDALATLRGAQANDFYGFVADELGDLDGDGRTDFIVGAPLNNSAGAGAGRAYVYSGATATLLFTLDGPAANVLMGWSVAKAGDIDGDGTGDIIVGGPGAPDGNPQTVAGVARIYSGADGTVLRTLSGPAVGSHFGNAVDGIGDVDADGVSDVLIGAEGASGGTGQAFVVSGMTGATLRTHTGTAGTHYGYGLGGIGDVTADGVPDYAIGGGQGLGGRVEVRSGADGALVYTVAADASGGRLGFFWVDAVGDVDGDGVPDVFAGDIDDTGGRGRGYVFSGADGTIVWRLNGEGGGDNFGISHNSGLDVDGDGIPDLFVAGYHNDEGANDGGKAYVYSGATGSLLRTMTSRQGGQGLGYDAVQLGDVDGDGVVDYLLTGNVDGGGMGTAIVIRGTPLP